MTFGKLTASIKQMLRAPFLQNTDGPEEAISGGSELPEEALERERLQKTLQKTGHDIQVLAQSSEKDFLAIGEKLQSLWDTTSGIAERGRQAAKLMSGNEIAESIGRVQNMVERMERYLDESKRRMEQNFSTIQMLLESIHRAERPLAGLHRIVTGLQTLGVSTRIESALISQRHQNFVFLADEVNIQSDKIKVRSEDLLEKMQFLGMDITRTLGQLKEMSENHRGSGGTILENLKGSLSILMEKQETASSIAQGISEQSEALSRNLGQVVMSMQFHDITRQQIEHVKTTLDELVTRNRDDLLGQGCMLQAAQVRNSRNELASAVDDLQNNLLAIAGSVREMVGDMTQLTGIQGNECAPSFGGLEADMASAAVHLKAYKEAEESFGETIESFVKTLEGMKDFSHNIEMIGRSIKFVALNATIQAARIGREGAAMDVVAQGIRQLSSEAKNQTDIISSSLNDILTAADSLQKSSVRETREDQNGLDDLSKDLNQVMDGVCTQNETAIQLLKTMDDTGRGLAEDVEKLSRNISIHNRMNKMLGRAENEIKEIGRLFEQNARAGGMDTENDVLENLAARYTMDSERVVHQDILKAPSQETDTPPADENATPLETVPQPSEDTFELFDNEPEAPLEEQVDNWGDNIDLFSQEAPVSG